jgi:hypothetical protein
MKSIIVTLIFLISFTSLAQSRCSVYSLGKGVEAQIYRQSKLKYLVTLTHKGITLHDYYSCDTHKKIQKCVGDNDGGIFYLNSKQELKVHHFTMGNPDNEKEFIHFEGHRSWIKKMKKNCVSVGKKSS